MDRQTTCEVSAQRPLVIFASAVNESISYFYDTIRSCPNTRTTRRHCTSYFHRLFVYVRLICSLHAMFARSPSAPCFLAFAITSLAAHCR